MLNKKGDIGETMTWIIATVVIVLILVLSFFISGFIANYKNFSVSEGEVETGNQYTAFGRPGSFTFFNSNLFENKTNLALNINNDDKEKILKWIDRVKKYE